VSDSTVFRQRLVGTLAVLHSIVVLLLWFAAQRIGFSGRVWLAIAWLWLVWPVLLAILPGRSFKRFCIPVSLSLVIIAVCIPTLLAMTAWAIGGFAP
jgi:hypothetical protein